MGTLSELAALGKPAIVIPMPGTHQEENAAFFARHGAVVVLPQVTLTPELFMREIKKLLSNPARQHQLSSNILRLIKPQAAQVISELALQLLK